MKRRMRLVDEIEQNRRELANLVEKHNFNFQNKAVIDKSEKLDKLLNRLNRTL
jgi:hypothetical protein